MSAHGQNSSPSLSTGRLLGLGSSGPKHPPANKDRALRREKKTEMKRLGTGCASVKDMFQRAMIQELARDTQWGFRCAEYLAESAFESPFWLRRFIFLVMPVSISRHCSMGLSRTYTP
ncbi:hypothetical protein AbraIFM66951_009979 [Aspergillus brasiliensis]|uniref:Uncharacterized protein n=1 Tax=Aspergillus brasiliensis TaxID=319629 RepID=A0A9W5Z1M1_9EURO|nr:hypothetical protein AbraCBS73388_002031 [Aspergillus brasiliensis]GKZ46824.1 hypothetical protein AbraIFM66951_009979 [Aspergillus brasiliensis]